MLAAGRWTLVCLTATVFCLFLLYQRGTPITSEPSTVPNIGSSIESLQTTNADATTVTTERFEWRNVPQRYPVASFIPLPTGTSQSIPKVQYSFRKENSKARAIRKSRLNAVKGNFTHAWRGYKQYAWMSDEVEPLSGGTANNFGGWAATLVDSLDTLWIMELFDEFNDAVAALKTVDFSTCVLEELNVFETTIRYLGGFLAAYDLSGGKYNTLLDKAVELGDMLYMAFDTPNRMPITRWNWNKAKKGEYQQAGDNVLVAELGSMSLEFTRLSQITGDIRYFDAIQRITDQFDEQQMRTHLPGMWPVNVDARNLDFTYDSGFTVGGMADSLYEYLPKQHMLLGGSTQQYRRLYERAMKPINDHIFYRPMTQDNRDILLAGQVHSDGRGALDTLVTEPQGQHLACFVGGMIGIGAKIFDNSSYLATARKLVDGCVWAYESMPLGVMPEIVHTVPCVSKEICVWDEGKWHEAVNKVQAGSGTIEEKIRMNHLPPGFTKIDDSRYILRPEAIESVFILYRITGDPILLENAWNMFNAIVQHTLTDIAHAALDDCTIAEAPKADRMESFWLAETLKYFYLVFSDPGVISLDEFVFNTEAHPLKRPV